MQRKFNISLFFALKAQVQKSVKTAMDGSFRNFGKVSPPERAVRYGRARMVKLVDIKQLNVVEFGARITASACLSFKESKSYDLKFGKNCVIRPSPSNFKPIPIK